MKLTTSTHRVSKHAFTLTEVIIASSIAVILSLLVFFLSAGVGKVNFNSVAKLEINKDIRKFSDNLTRDVRSARQYRIYTSTTDLTMQDAGFTGDVLVLVWVDPEPIETANVGNIREYYYRKFVIFARIPDNDEENIGPVWRYERTFPAVGSGGTPVVANDSRIGTMTAQILNDPNSNRRQVVQLSRGLATESLFFNSRLGRSITVNGEVYHGNRVNRVTNTYNFTVAPRG